MEEQQQERQPQVETNRGMQIKTFLGGLVVTEGIDLVTHGGWQGAAFAAGLAAILAIKSPELVEPFHDILPPLPTWGGRSIVDRALGRYPDDPHEDDPCSARMIELAAMPYHEYLQTPEWQERRQRIRARDGQRCQDCGSTTALDVHHLTYARRGNEDDDDLLTLCHTCHEARHGIAKGQMEALQPKPRAQLSPPEAHLRAPSQQRAFFTFSEVLASGFRPSLAKIYLATLEDGTQIFVPASKLCHVALAGLTRGGKGHIKRLLMVQLCYAGAEVYLLDPNYTHWDRESEDPTGKICPEDWTPFAPYLQNDPSEQIPVKQKYQVIGHYLQAAKQELDRRLECYGKSQPVGRPMFLFIDELPDIVDNIPGASGYLKSILRMGAKVKLYVVVLSQDFLVKTLFPNEGGAIRDCFRTAFYVGGDAQTAHILLDMPAREVPENRLGKGRVMVRCDVVRPAQQARVPYVDNEALYALLGPSTFEPGAAHDEETEGALVSGMMAPAGHEEQHTGELSRSGTRAMRDAGTRRQERVQRLRSAGVASVGSAQAPIQVQDDAIEISAQDAFAVWSAGNANVRDLARAMGVTIYKATQLYGAMVEIGLIERKTKITVRKD